MNTENTNLKPWAAALAAVATGLPEGTRLFITGGVVTFALPTSTEDDIKSAMGCLTALKESLAETVH